MCSAGEREGEEYQTINVSGISGRATDFKHGVGHTNGCGEGNTVEDVDETEDSPENEHSAEALGMIAARCAIQSVTQADVSELRSFLNPPVVVEHVAAAVMTLLEGKPLPWLQAKALMARSDHLSRLRGFDANSVTQSQLQHLESLLLNPKFQPAVIEPLSKAASKMCLWVLGV
ncbi:unnamed protein product, partial [Choristocarpus tenellus]